ncbi:hypothetical protein QM027_10625 [Campylobacter concisus]
MPKFTNNDELSLKLDSKTREILAANLASTNPEKARILRTLNEPNPALSFANTNDTKSFLELLTLQTRKVKVLFLA